MGKYKINISYGTGDSFSNSDETDYLELDWDNIDVAKENLQRIREHYEMYSAINSYGGPTRDELFELNKNKDWFVNVPKLYCISTNCAISEEYKKKLKDDNWEYRPDDYYAENCLILKADNGNNMQIGAFWCGHFETLYGADIEEDTSDMKIRF